MRLKLVITVTQWLSWRDRDLHFHYSLSNLTNLYTARYRYNGQSVVQVFAYFLFFVLFLFFDLRRVLLVAVVDTKAEEHLHDTKAVVEVAEAHLIETWKKKKYSQY